MYLEFNRPKSEFALWHGLKATRCLLRPFKTLPDNLVSCMTIEEIRELIQLVSESGVAEIEVQGGENRVRIRRSFGAEPAKLYEASPAAPVAAPPATTPALKTETPPAKSEPQLFYAKSP